MRLAKKDILLKQYMKYKWEYRNIMLLVQQCEKR